MQLFCPKCAYQISEAFYFCPNCGKKLKQPPPPTGLKVQILIYLFCIFLPPLGLWPGIRYLSFNDKKTKIIGVIAICLTILSSIATLWLSFMLLGNTYNQIQSIYGTTGDVQYFNILNTLQK